MENNTMRSFAVRTVLAICMAVALPLTAVCQIPAAITAAPAAVPPAAATPAPAPPTVAPTGDAVVDKAYVLGVGDTIEVALVGRTDFTTRARIGSDGAVLLPLIGAIPAVGKSAGKLAEDIGAALQKGGFFAQPVMRVDVVGVGSRYVTILGAVGAPGLLSLDRDYHLSEVVARVGGRTPGGVDYVVLTHKDGTSKNYKLAELATAGGDKDPLVASGDKVYIPAAENQLFYMSGAVKNPGAYPIVEGMTVRTALARAGGLTDQGSEKKVTIKRKGVDVKNVKLDVTTLEPGDIVTVGERLF
jgi:polysaccharide export outer membrane protein